MIKTSEEFLLSENEAVESLPELLNCKMEELLFLDIETTGLSPKTSDLYLIGVAYYQKHTWHVCQYFAESLEQEKEVLKNFAVLARSFKYAIHYNGDRFDVPYLKAKYEKYGFEDTLGA